MPDYPDCPACGSDRVSVLPGGRELKCFGECGGEKHDLDDKWEPEPETDGPEPEPDDDGPPDEGQSSLADW